METAVGLVEADGLIDAPGETDWDLLKTFDGGSVAQGGLLLVPIQ